MKRKFPQIMALLLAIILLLPNFANDLVLAKSLEEKSEYSGDVILYQPNNKNVITSNTNQYGDRLKGEVIDSESEDYIPSSESVFTITKLENTENEYYITQNGKYLTSKPEGNGLLLSELSEDSKDLSIWIIEERENGTLLQNKGARYQGTKIQYIEFYNGNFTTYGINEENLGIYLFDIISVNTENDVETPKEEIEETSNEQIDETKNEEESKDEKPVATEKEVVIFHPNSQLAISSKASGNRLEGVEASKVEDKVSAGDEAVFVQVEVSENEYQFIKDDKFLTSGKTGNALTLSENQGDLSIWVIEEKENGVFIRSKGAKYGSSSQYIEYYNTFTTYGYKGSNDEAFLFEILEPSRENEEVEVPASPYEGQKVLYFPKDGVAATTKFASDKLPSEKVEINDNKVVSASSDMVFNVIKTDAGFEFEQDGLYLTTSQTGGNLKLAIKDEYSTWNIEETEDGLYIINANAKYNNKPIYMEVYGGNFTTYSFNEKNKDIYTLNLLDINEIVESEGLEVKGLEIFANPQDGTTVQKGQEITLEYANDVKVYYTISTDGTMPEDPNHENEEQLYQNPILVEETPQKGKPIAIKAVAVKGENEELEIGNIYQFKYVAPENINDREIYFGQIHNHSNLSDGAGTIEEAFRYSRYDAKNTDFIVITDHSNYFENRTLQNKDGSTIQLPADGTTSMGDENAEEVNQAWRRGKESARNITEDGVFVGMYAYEMTWSGGPGHMNTYNSRGFEQRNSSEYKGKSHQEQLQTYYATLKENPETISMFNHPGPTFGDFLDFAFYDSEIDKLITLIEVGNGEGQVGSDGYFPSYDYYTRALDKGWKLAPTNGQDVHKGVWGDSNTTRTVVMVDELNEESIYDAMRNYKVYATEDEDLEIKYSLNDYAMGSILPVQESISIKASINDPTGATSSLVEVVANGGQVLASKEYEGGSFIAEFDDISTAASYYFVKVTQDDGQIAVTAPVWVGETVNAGIEDSKTTQPLVVVNEESEISSQIYNNTGKDMTIKSLTYTFENEDEPFHLADVNKIALESVLPKGEVEYKFNFTPTRLGNYNVNVELTAEIDDEEYVFTDVVKLEVMDPSILSKVLIDGSHYNDYVSGYYAGSMTELVKLGAENNYLVDTLQPEETITKEKLDEYQVLIVSAPSKRTDQGNPQVEYRQEFIDIVAEWVKAGGRLIVTGLADYQDRNQPYTTYYQTSRLLEAVGSTMRINDDELIDNDKNGGQNYRLYFNKYNRDTDDEYVMNILREVPEEGPYSEYSSYSGASVNPGEGTAIVFGHDTTYSINSRTPNQGHDIPVTKATGSDGEYINHSEDEMVVKKGDVVSLATEKVGDGRVFVAGTSFMSNYEIGESNTYSNKPIIEAILEEARKPLEISTIEEVRNGKPGEVFTVVAHLAIGTDNTELAFFNTTYIQDEKGNGINIFPVDDNTLKIGDQILVTGYISDYLGEPQLQVIGTPTKVGEGKEVIITPVTTSQANDFENNFGKLVQVEGVITRVEFAAGRVSDIYVKDESGEEARLFIDGYIESSKELENTLEELAKVGQKVSGIGFVSRDTIGNRLRVRDRAEIIITNADENMPLVPLVPATPIEGDENDDSNDIIDSNIKDTNTDDSDYVNESKDDKKTTTISKVENPKTFDAGISIYVLGIVISSAAYISTKKKK